MFYNYYGDNMKKIVVVFLLLLLCSCTKGTSKYTCPPIENDEFIIHFNSNGGNDIEDIKVNVNSLDMSDVKIDIPVREGYRFEAWYYDKNFLMRSDAEYIKDLELTYTRDNEGCENGYRDINLYALWFENPQSN